MTGSEAIRRDTRIDVEPVGSEWGGTDGTVNLLRVVGRNVLYRMFSTDMTMFDPRSARLPQLSS